VLLFKKILDFQKSDGGLLDKRGAKRYAVGAKFPLKAKITLIARDGEGHPLPASQSSPMDWGGQLVNLSSTGASMRLHPAAIAARDEPCMLKLELDHLLFEIDALVASYKILQQHVLCGIVFKFSDRYVQKAYLQLMEPILVGSTLEPATSRVKQDIPGLVKEQYQGESESVLSIWRAEAGKSPKLFELQVHDYYVRGNTELPGLKIGYRDGAKVGRRVSTPAIPVPMSPEHQAEVTRLFQFVVQNLGKGVPADVRRFLELFAA
jgi:hypothetical protein